MKKRTKTTNKSWNAGEQNSQYGTCWIYNIDIQKSIRIKKEQLDNYISTGWRIGRIRDFNSPVVKNKKHWYYNDELQECKLFTMFTVPSGWIKGKKKYDGVWCNGSTRFSKSLRLGSYPGTPTICKELSRDNIIYYTTYNPGIYLIHNKINNKCYVGQAKQLRKRLCAHLGHFNRGNRKYPIYKAFAKYGLENFEFTVLSMYDKDDPELQTKLDADETKYIKEYNSYGATGYNQTYGGDAGITGYKMTDKQRKHISENSKKQAQDGRFKIYVYNLNTKTYEEYINIAELNNHYNIKVHNAIKNLIVCKFLIVAKTQEQLEEKITKFKLNNYSNYVSKSVIIPEDFYEYYCTHTKNEICRKYNITISTIYNWLKQLGKSPLKQIKYQNIPDDFIESYYVYTIKELCEKYNIGDNTIYKWVKQLNLPKKKKLK